MSPSVELSPPATSAAAWNFSNVAWRRYQQQQQQRQQQQQQQPAVKVVSPRELQGIVARLSRSPGDPPPPPPSTYYSSGSHRQQQRDEHDMQRQPASTFRPIASSEHSPQEPPQALRDLLPQAAQVRGQGLSLNLASIVSSKMGATGYDVFPFAF